MTAMTAMTLHMPRCRTVIRGLVCLLTLSGMPAAAADAENFADNGIVATIKQVNERVAAGTTAEIDELNRRIDQQQSATPAWAAAEIAAISQLDDEQQETADAMWALSGESRQALQAGDINRALGVQRSALVLAEDALGPNHWLTIESARNLGFVFWQAGQMQEAETYYLQALDAVEAVLREDHPEQLAIHGLLAALYGSGGLDEEAGAMHERVTEGLTRSLGATHPVTLQARFEAIEQQQAVGKRQDAQIALARLCVDIVTGYGAYHPRTLNCLLARADGHQVVGELTAAEALFEEALELLEASQPQLSPSAFRVKSDLAELYRQQGRFDDSKALLTRVIEMAGQAGVQPSVVYAKGYLGRTLRDEGDLEGARTLTEEVLAYGTRHWLDRPLSIYNTLLELGAIYQSLGQLPAAEATFAEAYEGLLLDYGPVHPSTLVAAANLGQIYEKTGLYDQAEPLLKDTLELLQAYLGDTHPDTLRARNNVALLHESQGNFRESEPLYIESLAQLRARYGDDHNDTIAVQNNLAFLYMLMDEFDTAATLFEQVQQAWLGLFGAAHQNTLKASNNLGRVYQKLGRLAAAEEQISAALAGRQQALGKAHLDSIRSMIDLASVYLDTNRVAQARTLLTQALGLAESTLGDLHPYTFDALNLLATAMETDNQLAEAVALREVGLGRRSTFLDRMLWTTGENAREGYIRLHRPELNAYLSLLARTDDPQRGRKAINASLQRKGLLLKVTSEIQQIATLSKEPGLAKLAADLEDARQRLAAMTLSGPTATTQGRHAEVLYELEQQVNELQGQLGRASVRYRTSIAQVTAASLEGQLKDGQALVDFLYYETHKTPKLMAGVAVKDDGEVRYALVEYADRDAIEASISEYRSIIQDDLADEFEVFELGNIAFTQLWQPIEATLDGVGYVYLVPDGTLNILPFGALVNNDNEYLIRSLDLHLLSSGRDLLPSGFNLVQGGYVVVAGPDYDSQDVISEAELSVAKGKRSSALQLGIRGAGTGLRGLNFAPLPGAQEEGRIIAEQVNKRDTGIVQYSGVQAQERILSELGQPPEILHMATHGFFLEADDNLRRRLLKQQRSADLHVPPPGDNPLLRAGLAFAGINANAQFLGDIDTTNDGVLTALEVLGLNLSGTRLVVLSACETGLGEIHDGEGVYGLRRSFQEAGVAEVVSSLWEVSDAGTQALMTGFYDRLLAGQPARDALRDTQLALMDSPQWGYPYVWSAFTIVGSYESAGFTTQ